MNFLINDSPCVKGVFDILIVLAMKRNVVCMGVILLAYFIRYNNLFFIRRNMVVGQSNGTFNPNRSLENLTFILYETRHNYGNN